MRLKGSQQHLFRLFAATFEGPQIPTKDGFERATTTPFQAFCCEFCYKRRIQDGFERVKNTFLQRVIKIWWIKYDKNLILMMLLANPKSCDSQIWYFHQRRQLRHRFGSLSSKRWYFKRGQQTIQTKECTWWEQEQKSFALFVCLLLILSLISIINE